MSQSHSEDIFQISTDQLNEESKIENINNDMNIDMNEEIINPNEPEFQIDLEEKSNTLDFFHENNEINENEMIDNEEINDTNKVAEMDDFNTFDNQIENQNEENINSIQNNGIVESIENNQIETNEQNNQLPMKEPEEICEFYNRVGECKRGETCPKRHLTKGGKTVLFPHIWNGEPIATPEQQANYEALYTRLFSMVSEHGKVVDMVFNSNPVSHIKGHVLVKMESVEAARNVFEKTNNEIFNEIVLQPRHCSMMNLEDCRCKQFDSGNCHKRTQCNYFHGVPIPEQYSYFESFKWNTIMEDNKLKRKNEIEKKNETGRNRRSGSRERDWERSRERDRRSRSRERSNERYWERDMENRYPAAIGVYPPPVVPLYTNVYRMPQQPPY